MTVEFLGRTMAGCEEAILLCLLFNWPRHSKSKSFENRRWCNEVAIGYLGLMTSWMGYLAKTGQTMPECQINQWSA